MNKPHNATNFTDYEALAKQVEATDAPLAAFYRGLAKDDNRERDDLELACYRSHQEMLVQLYTARRRQGLTQSELAKEVGMPQSSLARIESSKSNPTLKTLLKIARVLQVDLVLQQRS